MSTAWPLFSASAAAVSLVSRWRRRRDDRVLEVVASPPVRPPVRPRLFFALSPRLSFSSLPVRPPLARPPGRITYCFAFFLAQ